MRAFLKMIQVTPEFKTGIDPHIQKIYIKDMFSELVDKIDLEKSYNIQFQSIKSPVPDQIKKELDNFHIEKIERGEIEIIRLECTESKL